MTKINIVLEEEQLDKMFQERLLSDYHMLNQEVRDLLARPQLLPHQQEDLNDSRKYAEAVETMLFYYFSHDEAKKIVDEEYIVNEYSAGERFEEKFDMELERNNEESVNKRRIELLEKQVEHLMARATIRNPFGDRP